MKPVCVFVLGVFVLGLTACGGGGEDPAPTATSAPGGAVPAGSTGAGPTGVTGNTGPAGATGSTGPVGGTAPAAGGGQAANAEACALLAEQTVIDAMGEGIAATRPESQGPTSQCTWDGVTTGRRYVTVISRPAQFATQVLENSYKNQAGAQPVDVGGEGYAIIGVNTPDYRYLTAAAIEGDLYVQVNVAGPERPDSEALQVITEALRVALEAAR